MVHDMTTGNLSKGLLKFCVPLILSGILQQMYNWTDALILGNVEGEATLAAVGATTPLSELLILFITGFSVGLSVLTAQTYGNGEKDKIQSILSLFTTLFFVIFLIVSVTCMLFTGTMLDAIQTPGDVKRNAMIYLQIIYMGIPCVAIYNVYSAVLRGIGDSKTPFFCIFFSSVLNCFLDIIMVYIFRLGIAGAAAATVLSQFLMMLFMIVRTHVQYKDLKYRMVSIRKASLLLKQGIALGMPPALQASVAACGNLLLQDFMNGFGVNTVTAITVAYRIDSVVMLPIVNLGSAISTAVAQNVGARKRERAIKGIKVGSLVMFIITIFLVLFVKTAGGFLISLFGVRGQSQIYGENFFYIISGFYIFYGMAIAIKSYLEGVGDMVFSGAASTLALITRIVASFALKETCGNRSIAYAEGISWVILLGLCIARFIYMNSKEKNQDEERFT